MSLTPSRERAAEQAITEFVLTRAALAIYDPNISIRPRAGVASFEIELLEFDRASSIATAAGTVVLRGATGEVEEFLRISLPLRFEGDACTIPDDPEVRASYIVPTGHPNGACKETSALARA